MGDGPRHVPEATDAERARYARRMLQDSRALLSEGRREHAEGSLRRGIAMVPEDASLHRALARLLEDTDRSDEAQSHRKRADQIDPVQPLPDRPIAEGSQGLVVVLVASDESVPLTRRQSSSSRLAAESLRDRLLIRLPGAMFVSNDPESVADARRFLPQYAPRAVISLRIDRAYCAESIKDGPFAVAWLRVAAQIPGRAVTTVSTVRAVVSEPGPEPGCESRAIGRALEGVLTEHVVRAAIAAPAHSAEMTGERAMQAWSRDAVRALFPRIGVRIGKEIEAGRVLLAAGDVGLAADAFRRAVNFDPADPYSRAYLREAEITLSMLRELAARKSDRSGRLGYIADSIDPRLSPAQIASAEARLQEEQRRRDDLLAALAVLDEDLEMPPESLLSTLRAAAIHDPNAFGVLEARRRAGGEVVARAAYAPSGNVLARYYYAAPGDGIPLVREEDTNGDSRPDRWIGYRGTQRAEIWEDSQGRGRPDRHFVFAHGGSRLIRIEIDEDANNDPERVFYYENGALAAEDRDTNGDGAIDCFDRFDANGLVIERAEDLNGDGKIDIRDIFRDGKLVRREINDPEVVSRTRPSDAPPIN